MLTWDEFSKAVTLNGKTYPGVSTVTALRRAVSKRREKSRLTQNAPPYSALPWTELAQGPPVDGSGPTSQPPDAGAHTGSQGASSQSCAVHSAVGGKKQASEQSGQVRRLWPNQSSKEQATAAAGLYSSGVKLAGSLG